MSGRWYGNADDAELCSQFCCQEQLPLSIGDGIWFFIKLTCDKHSERPWWIYTQVYCVVGKGRTLYEDDWYVDGKYEEMTLPFRLARCRADVGIVLDAMEDAGMSLIRRFREITKL